MEANHLPGGKVELRHIQCVVELDKSNELKVASNLSNIHISSGHFTMMKVSVALQLFHKLQQQSDIGLARDSCHSKQKALHGIVRLSSVGSP